VTKPSTDHTGDFDRFQSLARRILTTPKAELVKQAAPKVKPKPQASARKRKGK
jgi:hypothetical protein